MNSTSMACFNKIRLTNMCNWNLIRRERTEYTGAKKKKKRRNNGHRFLKATLQHIQIKPKTQKSLQSSQNK